MEGSLGASVLFVMVSSFFFFFGGLKQINFLTVLEVRSPVMVSS